VIAQTGVDSESALDAGEQRDDLFPVPAVDVVGDVIPGDDDQVNIEHVNSFEATPQIFAGDRPAMVNVTYVCYAYAV